jgi:hypothetical protein
LLNVYTSNHEEFDKENTAQDKQNSHTNMYNFSEHNKSTLGQKGID